MNGVQKTLISNAAKMKSHSNSKCLWYLIKTELNILKYLAVLHFCNFNFHLGKAKPISRSITGILVIAIKKEQRVTSDKKHVNLDMQITCESPYDFLRTIIHKFQCVAQETTIPLLSVTKLNKSFHCALLQFVDCW